MSAPSHLRLSEEKMREAHSHAQHRLFRPPFEWPNEQEVGLICSALINGGDYTPQRFFLQRNEDESGVSGTGRVAEGVVFTTGQVALCWYNTRSIAFYESVEVVEKIHGHGGKTVLEFIA